VQYARSQQPYYIFKQRDMMKRILLRELVHIVHPDTIGNQDINGKMVDEMLASGL